MTNIKYKDKNCNTMLNQEEYDNSVKKQDITALTCGKCKHKQSCKKAKAIFYGHYKHRIYKIVNGKLMIYFIWVQRVKCLGCGKTHSIAPDFHLYYHPFLLKDAKDLLNNNSIFNNFLDEGLMRAITRLINNNTAMVLDSS